MNYWHILMGMKLAMRAVLIMAICAAPHAFAQVSAVGCSTPTSNTVYFTPFAQTCLGASVTHSETTLINLHNTNALPVSGISCVAATAGTLRYKDGNMEFCNGSAWTSLSTGSSATATDRISTSSVASGSNLAAVVADQGTISFTTGGVAGTAYLDTIGRYIGPGVSITTMNGVSSTNGYFSGNVGIGTTTPSFPLHVVGSSYATKSMIAGSLYMSSADAYGNRILENGASNFSIVAGSARVFLANASGNVGIGTTAPAATLQVSGSFTVSTS